MAQAFSRTAVLLIKLVGIGLIIMLAAAILLWRWMISPAGGLNEAIAQPIRFSHKHHAGDDGIDCRYCHTSVEKAAFAGFPSTRICLTCHSQLFLDSPALAPLHESARSNKPIQWNRVHDLPGFAYFDHSIHVNKGVACVSCHGRVDQMPLTRRTASLEMQWCLDCHRSAPEHVRPLSEVFLMQDAKPLSPDEIKQLSRIYQLQSTRRLTDCSTCHR